MTDARRGNCFTTIGRNGQCRNKLSIKLTKKDCCCGMNMGKGWGDNGVCELCPVSGEGRTRSFFQPTLSIFISTGLFFLSDAYNQLCQEPGHISKINECILRPDICGAGKCIDTPDGYRCECKPGYEVGPSGVCEGIFSELWKRHFTKSF